MTEILSMLSTIFSTILIFTRKNLSCWYDVNPALAGITDVVASTFQHFSAYHEFYNDSSVLRALNQPLAWLIITCLVTLLLVILLPSNLNKAYKVTSLCGSGVLLAINVYLCGTFNQGSAFYQFVIDVPWLSEMNLHLAFGVDGISLVFLTLTTVIFPFCILSSWKLPNTKFIMINLILIELFLILTFTALDLFLFCVCFESLLIPMFFIILLWGARDRRLKALTYFFLYTLLGSIFLILSLFLVFYETNSTSYFSLLAHNLTGNKQMVLWFLLFITFAIKIPMFPFHIWLPEAHVEAPTVGSVILAGLLLKLGAYGMLRFLFVFDYAKFSYVPYVLAICVLGVLIASLIAIRQLDMKRIIAYSSIAHMNFALLGYFSNTFYGLMGGTLLMVSHGIVSAALFLLVGVLYDRYHTRSVLYYGGLASVMPLFAFFFFMFTISNFSFPGTSNFIGELIVLVGLGYGALKVVLVVGAVSTFFGLVYSILLYNRIVFGNVKYTFIKKFSDITRREYGVLFLLLVLNMVMGVIPGPVIAPIAFSIESLVASTTRLMLEDITWVDMLHYYANRGRYMFVDISSYAKDPELYARFWALAANPAYTAKMFFDTLMLEGKLPWDCKFEEDFLPVLYGSFLKWLTLCRKTYDNFSIAMYMDGYTIMLRHEPRFALTKPEEWRHVYPFLYLWSVMEINPEWTLKNVYDYLQWVVDFKDTMFAFDTFVKLSDKAFHHWVVDHMLNPNGTIEILHRAMQAYGVDPAQCSATTDVTKTDPWRMLKHPINLDINLVDFSSHVTKLNLYHRYWFLAVDPAYNAKMFFDTLISTGQIAATCSFDKDFIPALHLSFLDWVEYCRLHEKAFSMAMYMDGYTILFRHESQFALTKPGDWHRVFPFFYLWLIMEQNPEWTLQHVYEYLQWVTDYKDTQVTLSTFANLADNSFHHWMVDHMQHPEGTVERIHHALQVYGVDPAQCSPETDVTKTDPWRMLKHPKN